MLFIISRSLCANLQWRNESLCVLCASNWSLSHHFWASSQAKCNVIHRMQESFLEMCGLVNLFTLRQATVSISKSLHITCDHRVAALLLTSLPVFVEGQDPQFKHSSVYLTTCLSVCLFILSSWGLGHYVLKLSDILSEAFCVSCRSLTLFIARVRFVLLLVVELLAWYRLLHPLQFQV